MLFMLFMLFMLCMLFMQYAVYAVYARRCSNYSVFKLLVEPTRRFFLNVDFGHWRPVRTGTSRKGGINNKPLL